MKQSLGVKYEPMPKLSRYVYRLNEFLIMCLISNLRCFPMQPQCFQCQLRQLFLRVDVHKFCNVAVSYYGSRVSRHSIIGIKFTVLKNLCNREINHGTNSNLLIEIMDNIRQDINPLSQRLVLVRRNLSFSTIRMECPHLGITEAETEMPSIPAGRHKGICGKHDTCKRTELKFCLKKSKRIKLPGATSTPASASANHNLCSRVLFPSSCTAGWLLKENFTCKHLIYCKTGLNLHLPKQTSRQWEVKMRRWEP